ncbi:PREDICTED: 28S ribosomal protein S18c, mitochondrial isoform X1 [Eufriesea mexicana]|uniref:28S ribosomal protein S18c, mitochondrial isoform X1 n=1 Tax=Eufriesea mexicana TaxID=516756 RepID=UPI00083C4065|nr:PREDICTED: 28S ribosomal protein S18c, mitochondrial isoform X1 [Eufriesea mexicana]
MIFALTNIHISKYARGRIPTLFFRSSTNKAHIPDISIHTVDLNMPVAIENPYKEKRKLCILCKLNIEPDYKNIRLLSQFQSRFTGRIYEKHITGLCEYKQKRVEQEMRKAQQAGLMGFMTKDPKFVNDPMLFNPNFPFKPHKF